MRTNRVIVPDLPGHGASLLGYMPLDADRVLAWLTELIEQTCQMAILRATCSAVPSGALRQYTRRSTPWAVL